MLFALVLAAQALQAQSVMQVAPVITAVTPGEAPQGTTVPIRIDGQRFAAGMQPGLEPATGVQILSVQVVSPSLIQAQVVVAPSAPLGSRRLALRVQGRLAATAPSPFRITAAQAPAAIGAFAGAAPATRIDSFNPLQGAQGATLSLTILGANFRQGQTPQFLPGTGITVLSTSIPSAGEMRVQLQIAPDAPVRTHGVQLRGSDGQAVAAARQPFSVTTAVGVGIQPGPQVGRQLPSPAILQLAPNQVSAGATSFEIKVLGKNFAPGAQVSFSGSGIFVVSAVEFRDSTELRVKINVLPNAITGGRDVTVKNPNNATGTGKGLLNVVAAKPSAKTKTAAKPKPKFAPISAETPFTKGTIYLEEPLWGTIHQGGEFITDKGVPLLDDQTVFKWQEQNPSTADFFEVRFFQGKATEPVVTRRIDGKLLQIMGKTVPLVPTYFRPNAAFLAELMGKLPKKGPLKISQDAALKGGVQGPGKKAAKSEKPQVPASDLQWQVAGFRSYSKSGVKKEEGSKPADPVEFELEVSDRWPLDTPAGPTGLTCSTSVSQGGLQVVNVSDKKIYKDGKAVGEDPNNYPGDRFALTGNISLKNSPYGSHPEETKAPVGPGQLQLIVESYDFDNLFVDWGDGTIEPLHLPASSGSTGYNRGEVMAVPAANSPDSISHPFSWTGTYTVRVFQVSEDDLQKIDPAGLAQSVDGPKQDPYVQLVNLLSGSGKPGVPIAPGRKTMVEPASRLAGTSPIRAIADRAFMIFCDTRVITDREDTVASGPLHLVEIEIAGFPGHDVKKPGVKVQPGKAGPVSTKPGAVAPATPAATQQAAKLGPGPSQAAQKPSSAAPASGVAQVGATAQIAALAGGGADATASTCDEALQAAGKLRYYGRGKAKIRWKLDGIAIEEKELGGLSSEPRKNLGADPSKWGPPKVSEAAIESPFLSCKELGQHRVAVEAEVVPEASAENLTAAVKFVANVAAQPQKSAQDLAVASSVLAGLGKNPLKVGFTSPNPVPSSMAPALVQIDPKTAGAALGLPLLQVKEPPLFVKSEERKYQVNQSDPNVPCVFVFASNGGDFRVSDLQGKLTKTGTGYSGEGVLQFNLTDGPDSAKPYAIPLKFNGWDVPDGLKVKTGSLDVSPASEIQAPGVKGTLVRVQGKLQNGAKSDMTTTLSLGIKDQSLRVVDLEKPHEWKNASAPITAEGDWYLDKQSLPESLIGWSAFRIQSSDVRLDLSRKLGEGANSLCGGGSGAAWTGVHLGNADLVPYTMELVAGSALKPSVNDWALVDAGLCGSVSTGPFNAKIGEGSLHFDSLAATAKNGSFSAIYKGMKVHVPWLEADLSGDAKLQSGGGEQAMISFPLTGAASVKNYGNFTMKPANLSFGREENVGWSVRSDTHFDFKAENKAFANFDVAGLYFGMDGRAYFAKGKTNSDIALGGKSMLGETPLDLVSVQLTAPTGGNDRLRFAFATLARLSEVMPAADMQVNYLLARSGTEYTGSGPKNSPFTVNVAFPAGQPTVNSAFNPNYGTGSGTRYSGAVDLAMAGGPPISAEFLLGYEGGSDYWLTRFMYTLPGSGITLIATPPIMNLYTIKGGLGHNFPLDTFQSVGPIANAQPKIDGSFLFFAGMRVGMPDKFTYMLDGNFTVKATGPGAGARMDFHSWILKAQQTGEGDFQGYFQYTPGSFDGEMWGKLDLLGGAASIEVPKGAASMHFGGGPWHIYFGKKQGPRIKGHLLIAQADSYVMLGSEDGLAIGGSQSVYLGVGGSIGKAYVKGWMDMGLQITPEPKIIGDFGAGCEAGGCLSGACVSMGVNASVHAEALPVNVRAHACLSFPWPIPDPCINVHL